MPSTVMPHPEHSDQQLWKAMKEDDHSAFTLLVNLHTKSLIAYGLQFSDDMDTVKDCVQDLFVLIWSTRKKLAEVSSVRSYLLISLRRKLHQIHLQRTRFVFWGGETERLPFNITYTVQEEWISSSDELERVTALNALINGLPDRQKEVLYLKFFEERTTEEIAEIMNIRYQSVSNLVQRALENVRSRWPYELDILTVLCLARLPSENFL